MYQNSLKRVSYLAFKSTNTFNEEILLPQFFKNQNKIFNRNPNNGTGNFNLIPTISNRYFCSLLNTSININKKEKSHSLINIKNSNSCHYDIKNSLCKTIELNSYVFSIRHLCSQLQPQMQMEPNNHSEKRKEEKVEGIQNPKIINNNELSANENTINESNTNDKENNNNNNNNNNNENGKNENKNKSNGDEEEEEDELNILLNTKDNFFVREWKELKSFLWHLIFGSQILVHETQQALELKQKRIDNVPLTRRESLLIRRSFHDTLCVIPFFVLLAIEPYYLFLLSSIFPTLVPSVYVTPYLLKKNLEKNKKHRRKIAKSAAKLTPWVPFDVQALKDEKNLYHLSKNEFKQFDVDSLSWWHLKSCAGYLGLFGMLPKTILKIRMDEYFDYIKSDDEFIHEEGIESLTLKELRLANEQRGFNSLGLTKDELINNLNHWINFYTSEENKEIPRIVLILSHIYSDHIKFQNELILRKAYRKQKRQEFFKKFSFSSRNKTIVDSNEENKKKLIQ